MAKASGGGGGAGRGKPAAYSGPSNSFVRKIRSVYRAEYYIRKGSSKLTNAEINRAVRLGILENSGDNTFTMRI